ncbi:MAG TPA: HlyD family efflux transporter periplasmic adaptor subunit [Syntrophomonadaceae bacterium]|nr:HlyD family efflux transporter periplasmic adaptor subunit [Syntrophomonadaceae bacterium]
MSLRRERAGRRQKRELILSLLASFILLGFIAPICYRLGLQIIDHIKKQRVTMAVVQEGVLPEYLTARALVLNMEWPVAAPVQGRFENLVREGEKVRKGQELGYLVRSGQTPLPVRSPCTGIFTTRVDGLEKVLKNLSLTAMGPDEFSYQPRSTAPEMAAETGQNVCKVIDNLHNTTIIARISSADETVTIQPGDAVIVFSQGEKIGQAVVEDIRLDPPVLLQLKMDTFCQSLAGCRYLDVELERDSSPGLLVPGSSVISVGQEKRVYCLRKDRIYEKSINVTAVGEKQALVTGLDAGDIVVSNPDILDMKDVVR